MNHAMLQRIVEEVAARLRRRALSTATLSVAQLGEADIRSLLCQHASLRIVQVAIEDIVDVAADRAGRIRIVVEVEELLVVKRLNRLEDVKERDLVERARDLDAARAARDLDEPGLAAPAMAQRQKAQLDHMAEKAGAKVVYLGDTLQLQGVEAGKPFELAQRDGMETAYKIGRAHV
mgnify:CR=1 FL=1